MAAIAPSILVVQEIASDSDSEDWEVLSSPESDELAAIAAVAPEPLAPVPRLRPVRSCTMCLHTLSFLSCFVFFMFLLVLMACSSQVLPSPPANVALHARVTLSFFVNQVLVEPDLDTLPLDLPLANFLRERLGLTGTKIGCGEGGCGACTVLLSYTDVVSGDLVSVPVNSCLRPVLACDGMSITTIEGIGSSVAGYHPVQERYAWCMV